MTELQRYLAEEIAEDHADGLVSRREALRRLGLLGLGGAAAASLLAGILADEARARMRVAGGAGAAQVRLWRTSDVAARPTREIVFRGPGGRKLMGAWAAAVRPRGGVLVIHENRGLNDSIRTIAGRLAASGYSALAIDLLSEEGGTGSFADEFEAMAALGAAPVLAIRGGHEGGGDGDSPSAPREEGRGDRVLLRRRDGLAVCSPRRSRAWRLPFPSTAPSPRAGTSRAPRRRCWGSTRSSTRGSTPAARRRGRRSGRPDFGIRSSRIRASTTRSSTRPGHGTILPLRRPPIAGC